MQQAARVSDCTGLLPHGRAGRVRRDQGALHRRRATRRPRTTSPAGSARRGGRRPRMQRHFRRGARGAQADAARDGRPGRGPDPPRDAGPRRARRRAGPGGDRARPAGQRLDVEIDEPCVSLLALHQPAAGDLRFITTALKIVTDLERIGDQAVNIAQRVLELNREPQLKPYIDLPRMAERGAGAWSRRASTPSSRATPSWRARVCARRRRGGRPQGADLPRAAHLHDGGRARRSRGPSG